MAKRDLALIKVVDAGGTDPSVHEEPAKRFGDYLAARAADARCRVDCHVAFRSECDLSAAKEPCLDGVVPIYTSAKEQII